VVTFLIRIRLQALWLSDELRRDILTIGSYIRTHLAAPPRSAIASPAWRATCCACFSRSTCLNIPHPTQAGRICIMKGRAYHTAFTFVPESVRSPVTCMPTFAQWPACALHLPPRLHKQLFSCTRHFSPWQHRSIRWHMAFHRSAAINNIFLRQLCRARTAPLLYLIINATFCAASRAHDMKMTAGQPYAVETTSSPRISSCATQCLWGFVEVWRPSLWTWISRDATPRILLRSAREPPLLKLCCRDKARQRRWDKHADHLLRPTCSSRHLPRRALSMPVMCWATALSHLTSAACDT